MTGLSSENMAFFLRYSCNSFQPGVGVPAFGKQSFTAKASRNHQDKQKFPRIP